VPYLLSIFLLFISVSESFSADKVYAIATMATPVLNTPDFSAVFGGRDGRTLQKDRCGQIRAVEFVALPGTVFTIEAKINSGAETVYRVTSADYPYQSAQGYFIDSRAVRPETEKPAERVRKLPPGKEIIATMKSRAGTGYVWGGNLVAGVPQLLEWYGFSGGTAAERRHRQLAGVDCSGLLYEATGGYTPRNTSELVSYGAGVPVAGKSAAAIANLLQPLDLIVWPGHVMIVLDDNSIIESRLVCGSPDEGVRIRPVRGAVAELLKSRRPADAIGNGSREFVVRRWYGKEKAP
jgi:cell wall-associated NlpC family hydrolase